MTDVPRCVQCGAEVAEGLSAEGICPACLLKIGLPGGPDEAPTVTVPGETLSTDRRIDSRLAPGQTFGPYRVERLLGKGGMGEVYAAEELDSGRRVALKLLTHGLDEANRERFLREGRLAASVNHPNTIYIFGTDEIEGIPVIAMELAAGGTFKDKVKARGPLPLAEAVDIVVQLIAGLEAAADAGVLHRDIKPSNCFIDRDGVVKVGDFGLSISTLARQDTQTQLTETGSVLETPAFASPEQLRGDELDVRSDIYAVGATLYYLLTGRPPFDEANLVKLVAMVTQDVPVSPRTLRPIVPRGLAALVLRCLAKKPSDRVSTYAALTAALEPYGSSAPTPATLGLRFLAGIGDQALIGALNLPLTGWLMLSDSGIEVLLNVWYILLLAAVPVMYFAVSESVWGATIGKWVCGLRVVGADKEPPGVARALLRAAAYALSFQLPGLVLALTLPPEEVFGFGATPLRSFVGGFSPYVLLALLFSTARRKNGFAGIHDLVTATRVVTRSKTPHRPASLVSEVERHPSTGRRVGPYELLDGPILSDAELAIGYDDRLKRRVWIRLARAGLAAVPPSRRDLGRFTRLRWLAGKRTAEESWDVFEAPEGRPLLNLLTRPIEWQAVRHWLHDLAAELHAGLQDQSLPELGLDRVWITPDGGARLLDWPAPGLDNAGQSASVPYAPDLDSAQRFLHRVARTSLEGHPIADEPDGGVDQVALPLSAVTLLRRLQEGTFQTSEVVLTSIASMVRGPALVSRWRRASHLMVCGAFPMFMGLSTLLGAFVLVPMFESGDVSDFAAVSSRLTFLDREDGGGPGLSSEQVREREALEIYIASRFGGLLAESSNLSVMELAMIAPNQALLERVVATHPSPSPEEVSDATRTVERFLEQARANGANVPQMVLFVWIIFWIPVAVVSLLSAAVSRGGLALRLLGIAIVTAAGAEASRLRAFCRALLAWAPMVLALSLVSWAPDVLLSAPWPNAFYASAMGLLFLFGAIWTVINPGRGLQDRVAGTYLVRR